MRKSGSDETKPTLIKIQKKQKQKQIVSFSIKMYLNVVGPLHGVAEGGVHVLNHKVLLSLIPVAEDGS